MVKFKRKQGSEAGRTSGRLSKCGDKIYYYEGGGGGNQLANRQSLATQG